MTCAYCGAASACVVDSRETWGGDEVRRRRECRACGRRFTTRERTVKERSGTDGDGDGTTLKSTPGCDVLFAGDNGGYQGGSPHPE